MKHVAAVLLLALSKKEITEKNINEVLASVGIKPNPAVVSILVAACKGKSTDQLIKEGLPKLSAVAAAAPAKATSASASASAPVEKKEEKKDDKKPADKGGKKEKEPEKKKEKEKVEEPKEEEDLGMGFLF